jgi:hypothetical protein
MRFAIIASPRTGSSHLTTLLNRQPDVMCNGEICHPKKVFVSWPKADRTPAKLAEMQLLRESDPASFLEGIFSANYGRSHVGFKILRGQSKKVFNAILQDDRIRKIVLFRRNVLANYSSRLIALQTGKYALRKHNVALETEDAPAPLVEFNAEEFVNFRSRYEKYYASVLSSLHNSGQIFHFVNYEEINNQHLFSLLLAFIGADVKNAVLEGRHAKQNPSHIVSRFSNPDDAESFLREHNLHHWMYEGEVSFMHTSSEIPGGRRRARIRTQNSTQESHS